VPDALSMLKRLGVKGDDEKNNEAEYLLAEMKTDMLRS
jgi:hypothetical protein